MLTFASFNVLRVVVKWRIFFPFKGVMRWPSLRLMFANNHILFGEACINQIETIMNCLHYFAILLGQKVNHAKSNIFFTRNVILDMHLQILDKCGFSNTIDLGMYLGILLFIKEWIGIFIVILLKRVQDKLIGWKIKCLFTTGRFVLAKFVLRSLPIYTMQVLTIPSIILYDSERYQCNFIWGHDF